jgi:hypothetical protein
MVPQQRRQPPSAQEYYAVPQSPQPPHMQGSQAAGYNPSRPPARASSVNSQFQPPGRGAIAQGVASGAIGGSYGPYSVRTLYPTACRVCAYTASSTTLLRLETTPFKILQDLAPPLQKSPPAKEEKKCLVLRQTHRLCQHICGIQRTQI